MTKPIYKILLFLKRRPGMSVEDFRSYYENHHVKLCEKYTVGAARYVRRFLDPVGGEEMPFDVITEIWLEDRAVFEAVCEMTAKNEPPPEIVADEERLFDRAKSRTCTVVEHESDMEAIARAYA
jgi:hypothetical protein